MKLETIRRFVTVGCIALPLFAASEPKQATADRKLAEKIQEALAKDDSLSPVANSVTVAVQERTITLKGTVHSEAQSQAIQGKAESLLIQDTPDELVSNLPPVDNELVVAR